ncbi:hypothetical protein FRC08_016364 [Ceratobasidium sp. 394]|nr:hypothetical protein FRC08_016364 [Ceratobasidium sp. 394]
MLGSASNSGLSVLNYDEPSETNILDPDLLSGADQTAFYDLEELEDQHNSYISRPLELSALSFVPDKVLRPDYLPDPTSIFDLLQLAHPATQHLNYKLRGLKSILLQLADIECGHPTLIVQRDSLRRAIKLDIHGLVMAVWKERSSQQSEHLMRPFTSPLATSVIILTAVIHAVMGVGRESCNYILSALRCTLTMAASMQSANSSSFIQEHIGEIPTTLPTALHYLNLSPQFHTYTVCPKCSALYDEASGVTTPQKCSGRKQDGSLCDEGLLTACYRGGKMRYQPTARYSHFPLENWLSELLMRPGIEDILESTVPLPDSTLSDLWNAPYLCDFPGSGQPSFFDAPPGELRLAMLLFHDFFNPLTNKTSG